MRANLTSIIAIASSMVISGCSSPDRVIGTTGPVYDDRAGQWAVLNASYNRAYQRALAIAGGDPQQDSDSAIFEQLARDGFGLIDGNCSDFFSKGGDHEKWINFAGDAIAVGGTIATGALAITGAGALATGVTALSTSALYSGLDSYTKNFLFNSENISSVRRLILDVLKTDADARFASVKVWTFEKAIPAMQNHQEICRPSSIVATVKDAIQSGKAVAHKPAAQSTEAEDLRDEIAITAISHTLDVRPTNYDLGMLYWYFLEMPAATEMEFVRTSLGRLSNGPFLVDGSPNPAWRPKDGEVVRVNLSQLSSKTVTKLQEMISGWKKVIADSEAKKAANNGTLESVSPYIESLPESAILQDGQPLPPVFVPVDEGEDESYTIEIQ
jgi:hypothetical protein